MLAPTCQPLISLFVSPELTTAAELSLSLSPSRALPFLCFFSVPAAGSRRGQREPGAAATTRRRPGLPAARAIHATTARRRHTLPSLCSCSRASRASSRVQVCAPAPVPPPARADLLSCSARDSKPLRSYTPSHAPPPHALHTSARRRAFQRCRLPRHWAPGPCCRWTSCPRHWTPAYYWRCSGWPPPRRSSFPQPGHR